MADEMQWGVVQNADRLRSQMDIRFYWTIGIIVTLFGLQNGIMVALLKL